jgi:hypothetical protein
MRHRAIGAGGDFFFLLNVDVSPFWAWLEVPVAIGLGVFAHDHPSIVLLEVRWWRHSLSSVSQV